MKKKHNLFELAFGGGTPRKAILTALIVGTLLVLINHGDTILFESNQLNYFKVIFTYFVPYCVTTWGAILGKLDQMNVGDKILKK